MCLLYTSSMTYFLDFSNTVYSFSSIVKNVTNVLVKRETSLNIVTSARSENELDVTNDFLFKCHVMCVLFVLPKSEGLKHQQYKCLIVFKKSMIKTHETHGRSLSFSFISAISVAYDPLYLILTAPS